MMELQRSFNKYQYPNKDMYLASLSLGKAQVPSGGTGWVVAEFNGKRYTLLLDVVSYLVTQVERHPNDLDDPEFCASLDERVLDMQSIYLEKLYQKLESYYASDEVLKEDIILKSFFTDGWLERKKDENRYLLNIFGEAVTTSGLSVSLEGHVCLENWEITSVIFESIYVGNKKMACELRLLYEPDKRIASFRYGKFDIIMDDFRTDEYFALADTFIGRFLAIQKRIPWDVEFSNDNRYFSMKACVPYCVYERDTLFRKSGGFPLILDGVRRKLGIPS